MKFNLLRCILYIKKQQKSDTLIFTTYLFGIKIMRKKYRFNADDIDILRNVFNTSFKKKMLLSYITSPFKAGARPYSHTNYTECRTWAEIFNELGYQVDVVNLDQRFDIDITQYSVVCGFGIPYGQSLFCKNIKKIFYATGCNPDFANIETIKRVQNFYDKTGVYAADSSRIWPYVNKPHLHFSDMIIALGNSFVANTYSEYKNVKSLDLFCYKTSDINAADKNFSEHRNKFLYFGSAGAIHKGLDIVLDFFKSHPELNLTVCGLSHNEKAFRQYYEDVIGGQYKNIKVHNFVDLNSDLFKEIMQTHCAFVSPSASEGGAAAALTVMANGGLMPIISRSSGLDVEEYGIVMDNVSDKDFADAIKHYEQIPVEELKDRCIKCQKEIQDKHTYEKYRDKLKQYIIQVLQN